MGADYLLDVSDSPDFGTKVAPYDNISVADNRISLDKLNFNKKYYIRVKTRKGASISEYSLNKEATTGPPLPPPAPKITKATDVKEGGFKLEWDVIPGASEYLLDISLYSNFPSRVSGYDGVSVSGNSLTSTGLTPNTKYYCRLKAVRYGLPSKVFSGTFEVSTSIPVPILNSHTNIKSNSFVVRWNGVPGVDSYVLQISEKSDFSTTVSGYSAKTLANTITAFQVTGLTALTSYYYRIKAVKGLLESRYTAFVKVITKKQPTATKALPTINITTTSFALLWQPHGDATKYYLDVAEDNGFTKFLGGYQNLEISASINSLGVTGVKSSTTYYFRFRVETAEGLSPNSNVVSFVTVKPSVLNPKTLAATAVTSGGFTAVWAPYPNTKSYVIDIATDASFTSFVTGYNIRNVGLVVSVSVSGLSPDSKYYYRIRSNLNTGILTPNSNETTVRTLPLVAPTAHNATGISHNSFDMSWSTVPGAVAYRVEVSASNTFSPLVLGYPKEIRGVNHKVTGLSSNTTYYYRVSTQQNTAGTITYTSPSNVNNAKTLKAPVAAPTAQPASSISYDSFLAEMTTSEVGPYKIEVATDIGFSSTLSGYPKGIPSTSHTVSDLNPGMQYYFRFKIDNATSVSDWSGIVSMTTTLFEPPIIAVDATRFNEIDVSWSAVTGADNYELMVSTSSGFLPGTLHGTYTPREMVGITSHTVTGLSENTTYYFRIRSILAAKPTVKSLYGRAVNGLTPARPFSISSTALTKSGGKDVLNDEFKANDGSFTGSSTCGSVTANKNKMIPIAITNPPVGTTHYAVVIRETVGVTTNYLLGRYDISASGLIKIDSSTSLGKYKFNGYGVPGYSGPCPKAVDNVDYVITLYAMNSVIPVGRGGTTAAQLHGALIIIPLSNNVLGTAQLKFTLNKK